MAKKKFYAVRKGRTTGIFEDWKQCQEQITGFPGAAYKSFNSIQEAEAFLNEGGPASTIAATAAASATAASRSATRSSTSSNSPSTARAKWYAVASGQQVGVFYQSWDEVRHLVVGYPGALYKGFNTEADALVWLNAQTQQPPSMASESSADIPSNFTSSYLAADQQLLQAAAMQAQQQQQRGPSEMFLDIYFDGGSRLNPGRAGYGYAVFDRRTNERIRIGCGPLAFGSTNNEAEYTGMIRGMQAALTMQKQQGMKACHVVIFGDSQLAVKQLQGEYKVKGAALLPLYREAKALEQEFASFEIQHVYRDENQLADRLSNLAMDLDAAVDQVVFDWADGASRAELARRIAAAADLDSQQIVHELCVADSFLLAAAPIIGRIWDGMPTDQVLALLAERGWNEDTGGPPVVPPQLPARVPGVVAAAAAACGRGVI